MRSTAVTVILCTFCYGPLGAQTPPPPPAGTRSAPVATPRPVADGSYLSAEMARNGGSLIKASLSGIPPALRTDTSRADPLKSRLLAVSFVAVPDPEPKVVQKHEIITIIIREQTEYASEGTTDLKKKADLDARLEEWIKLQPANFAIRGGAQGENPPGVKMSASRNLKGEATVDRTDSYVTRIAAEVLDVKPNGTFVIQARKFIKHDDEEAEFVLTGVCRAADLTPDNTILSTQVHNLQFITNHKGAVKDTTNRGLIPKLLDFINPF